MQEGIAITQNFVSSVNLRGVLKILATKSEDLISGCPVEQRKTLHTRFLAALEMNRPEVIPLFTKGKPLLHTIHLMLLENSKCYYCPGGMLKGKQTS